jgi:hypothetical protein
MKILVIRNPENAKLLPGPHRAGFALSTFEGGAAGSSPQHSAPAANGNEFLERAGEFRSRGAWLISPSVNGQKSGRRFSVFPTKNAPKAEKQRKRASQKS